MKKSICILFLFFGIALAAQTLDLSLSGVTVKQAMAELKQQSGYTFIYATSDVATEKLVSVEARDLNSAVEQILQGQDLNWKIQDKNIIISAAGRLSPAAQQPVRTITGNVRDDSGESIIGAGVFVKGTRRGVVTDLDGNFSIEAKPGSVLVIKCMGYKDLEVIAEEKNMKLVMASDNEMLDELVIIGYGSVKKSDLTGAVGSVKGEELKGSPVASVSQALQGKVAGVTVTSNTGQPGSDVSIRIRGIGSVHAGVAPLYVVDGMIVSDIGFLSPNDIASTEVLKDASSAAIYGSRAANGVILITTKSGSGSSRSSVTFEMYAGVQQRWRKLDLMGAHEHIETMFKVNRLSTAETAQYMNGGLNAWLNYARIGGVEDYPVAGTGSGQFDYDSQDTDWQDAVFRTAAIQNYYVSVDTGNKKTSQAFSANWFSQDGTIIGSWYNRLNLHYNASSEVFSWLKLGTTINLSSTRSRWALNNNSQPGASMLSAALAMAPWDPVRYPDGVLNSHGEDLGGRIAAASNFMNVVNPYSMATHSHTLGHSERLVGSAYAEIRPFKDFVFRSDVNLNVNYDIGRNFTEKYHHSNADKNDANAIGQSIGRSQSLLLNNYGTWSKSARKHDFSVMLGHTLEISKGESVGVGGRNILNDGPRFWSLSYATSDFTYGGSYSGEYRRMSFISRIQYSYDSRYLLTFNWRSDGNRAFQNHPWGHFPSVAAAWKINEEPWFGKNKDISLLKLRLGWGRLGNDSVDSNLFTMTMDSSMYANLGYPFGPNTGDQQSLNTGAAVTSQKNLNGRWEISEHYNLGIDAGFFRGRLTGSADFFIRDTRDMLLGRRWPYYAGVMWTAVDNIGTMRNSGVEFQLDWKDDINVGGESIWYGVNGNISFVKNKLIDMNGADPVWGDKTVTDEGFAVGSFWGYRYDGIFRSQQEIDEYFDLANNPAGNIHNFAVGDIRYRDLNGDHELDDQEDMEVIGNPFPKFTYGLNLSAGWGPLDIQLFFQGVYGNQIYNALRSRIEGNGLQAQLSTSMRDVWTTDNNGGSLPNPNNTINFWQSDRFLESGSYLRLKNAQLGYTLPERYARMLRLQNLRVYISAANLLTFTGYSGYDPEVGGGVDYGNYPQSRTLMMGLNLKF